MAAKKMTVAKTAKPAAKAVAAETAAAADAAEAQRGDQVETASTAAADTATAAANGGDQRNDQVGTDDATIEASATAMGDPGQATAAGDATTAPPAAAVADMTQVLPGSADMASAPAVCSYRVLSNLEHDLVFYAPGSVLPLSDDQAAPLLGHTVTPHTDLDTDETAG